LVRFMRHKMINLCPTTFEIASKMKNFSGWVRQELLKQHQEQQEKEDSYTRYRCPSCWKVFVDRRNFGEMHCMNRDCGYTHKLEPIE
jgi:ribosomal protein L37AE/L43A